MRKLTLTLIDDSLDFDHIFKCGDLFLTKTYSNAEGLLLDKLKSQTDLFFLDDRFTSIGKEMTLEFIHFFSPHSRIFLFRGELVQEYLPSKHNPSFGPTEKLTSLKSILNYLKLRPGEKVNPAQRIRNKHPGGAKKIYVRLNGQLICLENDELKILEKMKSMRDFDLSGEAVEKKNLLAMIKVILKLRSQGIELELHEEDGIKFVIEHKQSA